jgi:hypothetical protein
MPAVGGSEKFLRGCRRAFERGSAAALVVCVRFLPVTMTAQAPGEVLASGCRILEAGKPPGLQTSVVCASKGDP